MTSEEHTEVGILEKEFLSFSAADAVVDLYRERLIADGLVGRVLQWSKHVLIVERLNEDYAYDGLSAIRPSDLSRIRAYDRELRAVPSLLAHERPARFDKFALLEISAALTKFHQRYAAVAVYTEAVASGAVFVGQPEAIDDDFLVLQAWGTARSSDTYRLVLRVSEITRVDADTAYVRQLTNLRRVQGTDRKYD